MQRTPSVEPARQTRQIAVRLPGELDGWLRAEAARTHRTVADVVRTVLWAAKEIDTQNGS